MSASEIRELIERGIALRASERDAAIASLRQAADAAAAEKMPSLEAWARHELGSFLARMSATSEEALRELHHALNLRTQLADVRGQIETLVELGTP